ncbi:MAG: LuxR C-terminal-related transcriptional regulator [Polyangiaceae bacterium]
MDHKGPTPSAFRLAELIGGLTLACDIASGFAPGKVVRTVTLAMRLGRAIGAPESVLRDTFYTNLLRFLGCTGFSHEESAEYGALDDIALRNVMAMADVAAPTDTVLSIARGVGRGAPILSRAAAVARLLGDGKAELRHAQAQCETSIALAKLVGMSDSVLSALAAICERWDGRGYPARLEGDAIALPMRLHHVADVAEIAFHRAGEQSAREVIAARAAGAVDPMLARTFLEASVVLLDGLDGPELWELFLDCEPEPYVVVASPRAGDVARAFAHLADLKSGFTVGHSTRVAALATRAAEHWGLKALEREELERAALLHDLGRLSVPNTIWDHPGRLGFAEWERVRLHSYYTERALSQSAAWRPLASLASGAHEQPRGRGYHRSLSHDALGKGALILAAADAVSAMGEPRAHRPALSQSRVESELATDVRTGRLDARAVDAVLGVRGAAPVAERPSRALSERELEVLRLVARGKTNKEIGLVLGISARTAQVHVAHVYDKLGVESRAGAALYAVENGLLDA